MIKSKVFFCSLILFFILSLSSFAAKVVELEQGHLKLKVFKKSGSFCLYQLSTNGKNNYVPLYEDVAHGKTNKFSVSLDGKIYRLERKMGKPLSIEKQDEGILITFNIKNKLHVTQMLSFVTDEYGNTTGPLLKIVTTIENTQSKEANVALRAVFDTSLGEHTKRAPLATDLRERIVAETVFNPKIDSDSVIISSNKESACMFFFKHGVDMPEQVYVANWERMHPRKWYPKVMEGRSFNSRYLHDDSACLFIWSGKKLKPTEATSITTTIGYHDFVRTAKDYNVNSEMSEVENEETPQPEMTEEQRKNYDYIQELLNKIRAVEENPDAIDDAELEKLADEAEDAIKDIEESK